MDFIIWILKTIANWFIGQILSKTFMNEKSPLYYGKLIEMVKTFLTHVKMKILLVYYSVLIKLGLMKPLIIDGKHIKLKTILLMVDLVGEIIGRIDKNYKKQQTA